MFKRKLTKEEYNELPKYAQDSYEESDGEYVLAKVEGFVDKGRLEEFRNNNRSLQAQIDELTEKASRFNPEDEKELERLRLERQEMEEKDLIERGEIDTIVEQRTKPILTAHEKALRERDEKIASQDRQLSDLLIRDRASALAVKAGINGDQEMSDFLRRVHSEFKIVNGKAVKMDGEEPAYDDSGAPVGLDEKYIEGVKNTASYLFRQPEGSGADPRGGQRRGGAANTEHMTAAQKIAHSLQDHGLV